MPITRDQLLVSYNRYLMARIAIVESAGFGGQIVEISQATLLEHKKTEDQYLSEQVAARAAEVTDLKAISHK